MSLQAARWCSCIATSRNGKRVDLCMVSYPCTGLHRSHRSRSDLRGGRRAQRAAEPRAGRDHLRGPRGDPLFGLSGGSGPGPAGILPLLRSECCCNCVLDLNCFIPEPSSLYSLFHSCFEMFLTEKTGLGSNRTGTLGRVSGSGAFRGPPRMRLRVGIVKSSTALCIRCRISAARAC